MGSSSAVLICGPFHGLPGSNSGTKSEMAYDEAAEPLLQLSLTSAPPMGVDMSEDDESGQPVSDCEREMVDQAPSWPNTGFMLGEDSVLPRGGLLPPGSTPPPLLPGARLNSDMLRSKSLSCEGNFH